ncbi:winged helix-turn-helix transcriptional regulator [bacterium]|nr:winged helix-turn-helix transcriptional regulator [bacterium]
MDVFTAVADPTRRQVLDLLLLREHAAGELVDAFPGLSQPAMSRHLRVLREVGLIQVRADAQRRLYSLRPEALAELHAWISRYRVFWAQSLDALGAHLDAMPSIPPRQESEL